jgi:hypothetical protein
VRRSLLIRLLALSLTVAACAIAATAWLTTVSTSDELRDDFQRTLEDDSHIYQELLAFARSHPSWQGVDEVVQDLATQTGQRIALTDADGTSIADSAAGADSEVPLLPASPATVIDPLAPALEFVPTPSTETTEDGRAFPIPDRPLSPEERDRVGLLGEAWDCLVQNGYQPSVRPPELLSDLGWISAPPAVVDACVPAALFAPSPEEAELADEVKGFAIECLAQATTPATSCLEQAQRRARDP